MHTARIRRAPLIHAGPARVHCFPTRPGISILKPDEYRYRCCCALINARSNPAHRASPTWARRPSSPPAALRQTRRAACFPRCRGPYALPAPTDKFLIICSVACAGWTLMSSHGDVIGYERSLPVWYQNKASARAHTFLLNPQV